MNKVNQSKYVQQYGLPDGQSKFDAIQKKIRESSSEKCISFHSERQLPTPFSFCDKSDFSQQPNQTKLQERQAIILDQFNTKQQCKQDIVNTFVANTLRLAKLNSYENIVDQCESVQQTIKEKKLSPDDVLCSLCSKHKFFKQKNKF